MSVCLLYIGAVIFDAYVSPVIQATESGSWALSGKLYLIGGIATPGESRAQAGEELITVDTSTWVCTRKFTTGAGPEFTDSHAAVIAGSPKLP